MAIDRALTDATATGNARIILSVPPRHGKSQLVSRFFPAWRLGVMPDRKIILCSYEAEFAASWGRSARGLLAEHGHLFGVSVSKSSSAADRWDIEGREGGMITAGVGGAITGRGGDVIIDDPVKNYEEAHSETYREKTWDWFTSTAYTRIEPNCSCFVIMTRWHQDDLAGRIKERLTHENWQVIRFPALATECDTLGRKPGEALWPERFSAERLDIIRKTLGSYQFSSLYQQSPTPAEGGMFKREWLSHFVDAVPVSAKRVRYWDKAATEGGGDPSAGVLMSAADDGLFYVEDVTSGQWSSRARNRIIYQTAELDETRCGKRNYQVWVEREGGSGGKESAEISVRELAGFDVHADLVTGSKESRARPFAAQCEAGNVRIVRGEWNRRYIDELAAFPTGTHDDQVDASSGAFNKLILCKKKMARVW